jgi:hypothetical protein
MSGRGSVLLLLREQRSRRRHKKKLSLLGCTIDTKTCPKGIRTDPG